MLFPMFNHRNNQFLIPALQGAGVSVGYKGFQKDKAGYKLKETEDVILKLRFTGTDAWDDVARGFNVFLKIVLLTKLAFQQICS